MDSVQVIIQAVYEEGWADCANSKSPHPPRLEVMPDDRIRRAALVEAVRGIFDYQGTPLSKVDELKDYRRRVAAVFEGQFPGITEDVAND